MRDELERALRRRARIAVVVAVVATMVTLVSLLAIERTDDSSSTSPTTSSSTGLGRSGARPLSVVEVALDVTPDPSFPVSGTYPQLANPRTSSNSGTDVEAVNGAIRDAIVADERAAVPGGVITAVAGADVVSHGCGGGYSLSTDRSLMSASSTVFSALLHVEFHNPIGAECDHYWVPVTVQVPSGKPVTFGDLFSEGQAALSAIDASVRNSLVADYPGADTCIDDRAGNGLAGTVEDYQDFVLTEAGIVFGFGTGHLTAVACGVMVTTVPWSIIKPYLSPLGLRLADDVRRPRPA
jgi:hypothetical protein